MTTEQLTSLMNADSGAVMERDFLYYREQIVKAAELISAHAEERPVVLLAGPSGSGKTTTALLIERELEQKLGCEATIHMDPIETNNEEVTRLRMLVSRLVKEVQDDLTIHDFRMVSGKTHTNLIFDVVAPHTVTLTDTELKARLTEVIQRENPQYFAVIRVDRSYV